MEEEEEKEEEENDDNYGDDIQFHFSKHTH
jgi:hypothetical protein